MKHARRKIVLPAVVAAAVVVVAAISAGLPAAVAGAIAADFQFVSKGGGYYRGGRSSLIPALSAGDSLLPHGSPSMATGFGLRRVRRTPRPCRLTRDAGSPPASVFSSLPSCS